MNALKKMIQLKEIVRMSENIFEVDLTELTTSNHYDEIYKELKLIQSNNNDSKMKEDFISSFEKKYQSEIALSRYEFRCGK